MSSRLRGLRRVWQRATVADLTAPVSFGTCPQAWPVRVNTDAVGERTRRPATPVRVAGLCRLRESVRCGHPPGQTAYRLATLATSAAGGPADRPRALRGKFVRAYALRAETGTATPRHVPAPHPFIPRRRFLPGSASSSQTILGYPSLTTPQLLSHLMS